MYESGEPYISGDINIYSELEGVLVEARSIWAKYKDKHIAIYVMDGDKTMIDRSFIRNKSNFDFDYYKFLKV